MAMTGDGAMLATVQLDDPDRLLRPPPRQRDCLPDGHLAYHVRSLVDGLNLTALHVPVERDGGRQRRGASRAIGRCASLGAAGAGGGKLPATVLADPSRHPAKLRMAAKLATVACPAPCAARLALGGARRMDQAGARVPPLRPARPGQGAWRVQPRVLGVEREADAGAAGGLMKGIPRLPRARRGADPGRLKGHHGRVSAQPPTRASPGDRACRCRWFTRPQIDRRRQLLAPGPRPPALAGGDRRGFETRCEQARQALAGPGPPTEPTADRAPSGYPISINQGRRRARPSCTVRTATLTSHVLRLHHMPNSHGNQRV